MKKQLKDKTYRQYTIKIDRVTEQWKVGVGAWEQKDKLFCADINLGYGRGIAFSAKTLRELFKMIKEELYI